MFEIIPFCMTAYYIPVYHFKFKQYFLNGIHLNFQFYNKFFYKNPQSGFFKLYFLCHFNNN